MSTRTLPPGWIDADADADADFPPGWSDPAANRSADAAADTSTDADATPEPNQEGATAPASPAAPPPAPPANPVTLSDWLRIYLETNPRITSARTGHRYWNTVGSFQAFLGREATLDDLTADNYGRWVRHRRDIDRVAAGSVRGDAEKLLALWRWFARRDGRTMPDVALPPKARKTPEAWVPEEVERLDKAARAADWWIGGVPANLYFPALIGVAINTGERHGAIHHLAPGDIHLEKRLVYFRAEHRKGGATDARKPISAETAHDLRLLLEASPADVFNVVQLTSTYPPMRRLLLEAGLKATRNNMFHAFRRYHATQVAIAGGDPTTALGHSDPSLARKSYVDPTQLPAVTPGVRPVAKPTPAPRPGWLARITGRAAS